MRGQKENNMLVVLGIIVGTAVDGEAVGLFVAPAMVGPTVAGALKKKRRLCSLIKIIN